MLHNNTNSQISVGGFMSEPWIVWTNKMYICPLGRAVEPTAKRNKPDFFRQWNCNRIRGTFQLPYRTDCSKNVHNLCCKSTAVKHFEYLIYIFCFVCSCYCCFSLFLYLFRVRRCEICPQSSIREYSKSLNQIKHNNTRNCGHHSIQFSIQSRNSFFFVIHISVSMEEIGICFFLNRAFQSNSESWPMSANLYSQISPEWEKKSSSGYVVSKAIDRNKS